MTVTQCAAVRPLAVSQKGPAILTRSLASRSLRNNVIWTVGGNFGFAACQWLILVMLAKLGSPRLVGQFALALGLTAPIMLLANLNLRAVQSTDLRDDYLFADYFRLRLSTTVLALGACLATSVIAAFSVSTALVIGLVALAKAVESMSDVFYGLLQKQEQMDRIAKSMVGRGIAALLAMTIILWATGSVAWAAAGMFLTWLAVLLTYDIHAPLAEGETFRLRHELIQGWRPANLRPLLPLAWLALPLGLVQMLISLNTNIPRFFIQAVSGEHELGIYSAIAYVTVAGSTFVVAVGQAVSPRLARLYARGDRAGFVRFLQQLTALFALCGALAVALVMVAGRPLLTLLYTPEYASSVTPLLILTLGFGVSAIISVFGFGITAARRFRAQVPLVALAVLVAMIASAILVPRLGVTGAAWALLASLIAWAIASGWVLRSVVAEGNWGDAHGEQPPVAIAAARSRVRRYSALPVPVEISDAGSVMRLARRPLAITDPVSQSRWVFVALCGYLASQAYTLPLVPIGPWPLWPGLPDLMIGTMLIAWLFMPREAAMPGPARRTAVRVMLGLTIFGAASYVCLTLLSRNLNTVSFGAQQQGPGFGLFEVMRLIEFLALFWIAAGVPFTPFRLRVLRRVVTGAFVVVAVSMIVTFHNTVPSRLFAPLLPQGPAQAGAWSYYLLNSDGYGLGTISYTHAYVAAQLTLLLGLALHLRGRRHRAGNGIGNSLLIALALAASLLSGSRAGFAGILLLAAIFVLMQSPRWVLHLTLTVALIGAVAFFVLSSHPPTEGSGGPLAGIVQHQVDAFQPYHTENLVGRNDIWTGRLENLSRHPWRVFTGWGLGSSPDTGPALSPHMLPLQIIMELGIGMLVLIGLICTRMLRTVWHLEGPDHPFFWATIALLVSSATQETFYPVPSTGYFLGFYLVALAIVLRARPSASGVFPQESPSTATRGGGRSLRARSHLVPDVGGEVSVHPIADIRGRSSA